MSFVLFFAVFIGLFLVCLAGYRLISFVFKNYFPITDTTRYQIAQLSAIGWMVVLLGAIMCIPDTFWTAPIGVIGVLACALGWAFVLIRGSTFKTAGPILFALCFISSYMCPVGAENTPSLPVVTHLLTALFGTITVALFTWLDRVPSFNVNATAGFLMLLGVMSLLFHTTVPWLAVLGAFLWITAVPLNAFIGPEFKGRGAFGGVLFLWGFLLMTLAINGFTASAIVAGGYYLFEGMFAVLTSIITAKRIVAPDVPFLTERVAVRFPNDKKLTQFILLRSLLFAGIGVVFAVSSVQMYVWGYLVCLGIVAVDLYRRLNNWGQPKVRFKDLFFDMKQGVRALAKEVTNIPLKEKTGTLKSAPKLKKNGSHPKKTSVSTVQKQKTNMGKGRHKKETARTRKKRI